LFQFDLPKRVTIYSGSFMGVTLTDVRNPISFDLTENYPTYVYDVHEDNYPAMGDSVSFSNTPSMVQLSLAILIDSGKSEFCFCSLFLRNFFGYTVAKHSVVGHS
jgi:hypothetical protein